MSEAAFSSEEPHGRNANPARYRLLEEDHALVNETDSPCRYLVFGNPQPHDVAVFTDSGRVSVKLTGESYRKSATMGYWDGIAS